MESAVRGRFKGTMAPGEWFGLRTMKSHCTHPIDQGCVSQAADPFSPAGSEKGDRFIYFELLTTFRAKK